MIPKFVEMVLKYKPPSDILKANNTRPMSIELVIELQSLFSKLTLSDRKYISPEKVLKKVVDDFGNKVMIGEQKDAGEFNSNFLSRISECLCSEEGSEKNEYSMNMKSEKVEMNGLMRLFFGKFDTIISSKDKEIELKDNVFGQISLRPSETTLYASWITNYFNQTIENYKLDSGETIPATQNFWITQLPSMLFFQVQRVTYNKDIKQLEKVKSPLYYDKEIYADLFMKQNRRISEPLINEFFKLQTEIKEYETYIAKWEKENALNDSIESVLGKVIKLMQSQKQDVAIANSGAINLFSPDNLSAYSGVEKSKQKEILSCLQQYYKIANEKVANMKAKLGELKAARESIFKKYQQNTYRIHSIIIHDGGATSGHYYVYIFDFESHKWWRYSDGFVKTEVEDTIFKEALGGFNNCTAYYLIYINANEIIPPSKGKMYKSYATMDEQNKDLFDAAYRDWVPLNEKTDILKDNLQLHTEVENFKLAEIMKLIDSNFVMKYNQLQGFKKDKRFENFYGTINFVFYLSQNLENLPKWWLLKEALFDCCQMNLTTLKKQDPIYIKLDELRKQKESLYPRNLELNDFDLKEMSKFTNEYMVYMEKHIICNYAMECINTRYWEEALNSYAILFQECRVKLEFHGVTSQLVKAIHLMLLTGFVKNVEQGRLEDAYNSVMLFAMGLSTFYKPSESFSLFASKRLQYLLMKYKDSIALIQDRLTETLQLITQKSDLFQFSMRLPVNIQSIIENRIKDPKLYSWVENWKEDGFTYKYMDNAAKCQKKLEFWINWDAQIKVGTLTMSQMDSQETNIQQI